jgi:uncharacterized membrane protein YgaE (UPF0421/DUF939 family)
MDDYKLKLILSVLAGVVFAFIFILLAFALPVKQKKEYVKAKPRSVLEQVSHSARNK